MISQFLWGLDALLRQGGFEEMTSKDIAETMAMVGVVDGLSVIPPDPEKYKYKVYVRGRSEEMVRGENINNA
jgi:hypothetical protein